MGFTICQTPDLPVEPPGNWDDIAFWALTVYTFIVSVLCISCLAYRRSYEPLRAKSVGILCIALTFSLVHLWSLFVGNEQSAAVGKLSKSNCILWNFWLPYFFGLNAWFVFMCERLFHYGMLTRGTLYIFSKHKRRIVNAIVGVGFSVPIFTICLVGQINQLSYLSSTTGECTSSIALKMCILIWVTLDFLALFLVNRIVNTQIAITHLNEFNALSQSLAVSFICLMTFVLIHFSGLQNTSFYRSIQVISLAFMYIFCFLRIIGHTLARAIRRDQAYAQEFRKTLDPADSLRNVTEFSQLVSKKEMLEDFLNYCNQNFTFHIKTPILSSTANGDTGTLVSCPYTSKQYATCIRDFSAIDFTNSEDALEHLRVFCQDYFFGIIPQTRVYISAGTETKIRGFLKEYESLGRITFPDQIKTIVLKELYYILGRYMFPQYKAERMEAFLQTMRVPFDLDPKLLQESGLLIDNKENHQVSNNLSIRPTTQRIFSIGKEEDIL